MQSGSNTYSFIPIKPYISDYKSSSVHFNLVLLHLEHMLSLLFCL